ncbi:flagellar hook-length control protein FliK [Paenibacillus sp. BR2-3]|uniref:flagellar hook-length control protein FliK n=1 Tax=Paenibacillus sp. BR2-3 TaxID=3048494 RepID=UPI003977E142
MSLVFQMISAGNGLTANPASSSSVTALGGNTEGTGSLLPFAQALIQKMTGTNESNNASTTGTGDPIALLQGLLKELQPTGSDVKEETAFQNTDLLGELAQDIEKLDESIEKDPALLLALQGWLLQVSALLPSDVPADSQNESGTGTAALSPLAQNPETLRFAVQDDLNRLVSIIQEAASSGNEELTAKGLAVLNNFADLMTQPAADKPKVLGNPNGRSTDALAVKSETTVSSSPVTVSAESGKNESDLSGTMQARIIVTDEAKRAVSNDESIAEFSVPAKDGEIVTAGQLSMRNGITAPLKAETPQVPVQHFAKEMTGLVTSKLEIVNKGGVAEATISLFPENLGQVDVKITMQNGHLVAQFVTEHAGAKDLLEQQMVQLRAALQAQGLQVEKLEVTQNNTPLQSQMQQEGRQTGSGGQQSNRQSKYGNEISGDAVIAAELNGEWKDWLVNGAPEDRDQAASFSAKA